MKLSTSWLAKKLLPSLHFNEATGSSCSTAVENIPAEQNSWGCGFEFCQIQGFFLLFSSLSYQSCVLISSPSQRCNTIDFPIKDVLSHAAWGKARLTRSEWSRKKWLFPLRLTSQVDDGLVGVLGQAAVAAVVQLVAVDLEWVVEELCQVPTNSYSRH